MTDKIIIVSTTDTDLGELSAFARQLGTDITAYSLKSDAQSLVATDATAVLQAKIAADAPNGALLLFGNTLDSKTLAGQVASRLKTSAICVGSSTDQVFENLAFGGSAISSTQFMANYGVIIVLPGSAEADPNPAQATDLNVGLNAKITVKATLPKQDETVNLASAKRVVGVGRGFAEQGDLQLAKDLASKLSAELACSRPITEGVNWLPRERYVGVSGMMLKPETYIAIGISGQIQHMVGCNAAKKLIAINKDKNAPVFKNVDVGIVGDLYEVLPALFAAL